MLEGSVKVSELGKLSGAFKDTPFVVPLSLNTKEFAVVLLPWMVTLPTRVADRALIAPVVSMSVAPVISDVPAIVPVVIVGASRVLLVKVSGVLRPTKVSVAVGRVNKPVFLIVLMTGANKVLLVKVVVPSSVTITPDGGNTATELIPVPPALVGSMPVIAAAWVRSTAAK